jgi:AraC family transcriptional activator of mtrCDE
MTTYMDKTFHLLLSNLELESSLFHVGQYCGDWRASTAGRTKASFHIVLHGGCWLHFSAGGPSVRLHAGEADEPCDISCKPILAPATRRSA